MLSVNPRLSQSATWVALEVLGGAGISSVGMGVIAVIIGPRALGLTAIALGIIDVINFFPAALFHDAIIQRQWVTSRHLGSAFWSVLMLSMMLGGAAAALAGPAAHLYRQPELQPLLLALSGTTICIGVTAVQIARLRRAMRFRAIAIYTLLSRLMATCSGLALAVGGQGPWAIVAQYGIGEAMLALLLMTTARWRFIRLFSFLHARELAAFGVARSAVHFVDMLQGRLFFALLGYFLPLKVLGEVNLAFRLVDSLTRVIASALARLYLPIFSRARSNKVSLAAYLRQAGRLNGILLVPLFAAIALTGGDFIRLLAPANWGGMAGPISWLAVAGVATVLQIAPATAILAAGRPLLSGFSAFTILILMLIAVLALSPDNAVEAAMCWVIPLMIGVPIELSVLHRAVKIDLRSQLSGWLPGLLVTAGIAAIMFIIGWMLSEASLALKLALELLAGGVVYLLAIAVLVIPRHPYVHGIQRGALSLAASVRKP
jgi:O-antigen/teichoic acid export membrane protein